MKRRLFTLSVTVLFFAMLLYPQPVFEGASEGILLWFQVVLPTLLPFMLMSGLMIHTNAADAIAGVTGPVLGKMFRVSAPGSFAILVGFLCGYPMGARVTADLLAARKISGREAGYLLSFCNNTSPMFIVSYVAMQSVSDESLFLPTVLILFLSPMLCSFLFRPFHQREEEPRRAEPMSAAKRPRTFTWDILDRCMLDSFDSITRVGGYIMLFSVLSHLLALLPLSRCPLFRCVPAFLEVTAGIPMLTGLGLPDGPEWAAVLGLSSFGGICAAAQTYSMIRGTSLRILPYLIEKLATMLVTSLICLLYLSLR